MDKNAYEKENEMLKQQLAELKAAYEEKIRHLTEEIERYKRKAFSSRTERKSVLLPDEEDPQMSLFDETETTTTVIPAKEETTQVKSHARKKKSKAKDIDYKNVRIEKKVIDLPDDEKTCSQCGTALTYVTEKLVRKEIHHIPADLYVVEIYEKVYKCTQCAAKGEPSMMTPQVPQAMIPHSPVTPSLMTSILLNKYQFALPLARQSKLYELIGAVTLSRETLANWVIYAYRDYCCDIVTLMREHLLKESVLHADETPVQVMREKGRKNTTKSYMWVYSTGQYAKRQIRIYDYQPGRGGKMADEFLKGFSGYLHTDAYSGYHVLEGRVTRCLCWVHARRNFADLLSKDMPNRRETIPGRVIEKMAELFEIEKRMTALPTEERQKAREVEALPRIEALFAYLENVLGQVAASRLHDAITYVLSHRKELTNYIYNGDCSISNNLAERAIRPFTIGRKNWLFSGSPRGAKASAAMYSLITTCLANHIDTRDYFMYLFTGLSQEPQLRDKELLEKYLPWNMPTDFHYERKEQ